MRIKPVSYVKYKKNSALQLDLIRPTHGASFTFNDGTPGVKLEAGCVMLQILPKTNERIDRDNISTMKLNLTDLEKLLYFFENGCRNGQDKVNLIHDPHAQTENAGQIVNTLTIQMTDKGFGFYLKRQERGTETQNVFYMSFIEAKSFVSLISIAIPTVLGWT